jgi:outer membrane murein-binding lipoprotein Lpp
MAAALVVGHANRVKIERLAGRVEVLPAKNLTSFPADFAAMTAALHASVESSKKGE